MYASVRRYEGVADSADIGRQVADVFVPAVRDVPGFVAYYAIDAGGGVLVSVSIFESQEAAEESNARAAGFVRDSLASVIPNPPQITAGEVIAQG